MLTSDLAKWYSTPVNVSEAHADYIREEILEEIYDFQRLATAKFDDNPTPVILVEGRKGKCLIETEEMGNGRKLVWFDYIRKGRKMMHVRFWMNASSVRQLGENLRQAPESKRANFDDLFFGTIN